MALKHKLAISLNDEIPQLPPKPRIETDQSSSLFDIDEDTETNELKITNSDLKQYDLIKNKHKNKSLSIYNPETNKLKSKNELTWIHQLPYEWIHGSTNNQYSLNLSNYNNNNNNNTKHKRRRSSLQHNDRFITEDDLKELNIFDNNENNNNNNNNMTNDINNIPNIATNSSYLKRHTFRYRNRANSGANSVNTTNTTNTITPSSVASDNSINSTLSAPSPTLAKEKRKLFGKKRSFTTGTPFKKGKKDNKKDKYLNNKNNGNKNEDINKTVTFDDNSNFNSINNSPLITTRRRNSASASAVSTGSQSLGDSDDSEYDETVNLSLTDDNQQTPSLSASAVMFYLFLFVLFCCVWFVSFFLFFFVYPCAINVWFANGKKN